MTGAFFDTVLGYWVSETVNPHETIQVFGAYKVSAIPFEQ